MEGGEQHQRKRKSGDNETDDEKKARISKKNESQRLRRQNESEEKRKERLEKQRERQRVHARHKPVMIKRLKEIELA